MADSTSTTDPTTGTTGTIGIDTDDDPTPDRYVVHATINTAGELELRGKELCGDTIEVDAGEDAVVKIKDTEGYYLYATELPTQGERAGCWGRNTHRGFARRKFRAVRTEANNLVFAVSTRNNTKIKYGPVIKVKPKG